LGQPLEERAVRSNQQDVRGPVHHGAWSLSPANVRCQFTYA
jgi:hypothetical protein